MAVTDGALGINYKEEYYYMLPTGNNCPLLKYVNAMEDKFLLYEKKELDESQLIKFRFGDPIPRNPQMGDVHNYAQHLVISDKFKEAMQAMQLKNVQYLPATIENPKSKEVYEGYWALHIYNLIYCLDKKKAEFRARPNGNIIKIKKLELDNEVLNKIPLAERLVFALGEERLEMYFHESVVEKLVALQPRGVVFCSLANWSTGFKSEQAFLENIISPE